FSVFLTSALHAHDPGLSTATFRLAPDKLEAVLVFSIIDAGDIIELDKDRDGETSKKELADGAAEMQKKAAEALEVSLDGRSVAAAQARCRFDESQNATVYLSFPATTFTNLVIRSKWLELLQPGHRQ